MPRPARGGLATTSGDSRTALPTSCVVSGVLGHADAERLPEAAPSRRGDAHRAAVLHPLGPAQIETTLREGGPYQARDVWPSLRPIHAQPTEVTPLRPRG